jgi:hypothetical protein
MVAQRTRETGQRRPIGPRGEGSPRTYRLARLRRRSRLLAHLPALLGRLLAIAPNPWRR